MNDHPLARMIEAGLNVTLNTDDPSISQIDLSHEYQVVCEELGQTHEKLHQLVLAGGKAVFLPEAERQLLIQGLEKELT